MYHLALSLARSRLRAFFAFHPFIELCNGRSLEQLGGAFSEAYGDLTHEGEADLRFSRDPLSLYKEGVSMYAKPARSVWRLAGSLSGGQQATTGLALLFGFQALFRSPFYLLDEVRVHLCTNP